MYGTSCEKDAKWLLKSMSDKKRTRVSDITSDSDDEPVLGEDENDGD